MLPNLAQDVEQSILASLHNSCDLVVKRLDSATTLFFIANLVDPAIIQQQLIGTLQQIGEADMQVETLLQALPVGNARLVNSIGEAVDAIVRGHAFAYRSGHRLGIAVDAAKPQARDLSTAENETHIFGPQVAFNESLATNIALLRSLIADPKLICESFEIGKKTHTSVALLYVKDLADERNVNTLRQRVTGLDFDGTMGSTTLQQLIEDNTWTIFPQMVSTERPDRVGFGLLEGKVALIVDGSPLAIVSPCTFLDFFKSAEDYYVRWNIGTFIRLLRMLAVLFSITLTPIYVAALTYHYEIIPPALLVPLVQTRSRVPFPPLIEALIMEVTMELLREAGVRLPTKVGQTMAIVGGIVIGQAAVQAGFTSNILIMVVALTALASFTTPSYDMGTSIRFVRFPMIILAGMWGFIGIVFGACFLLIHLLRQTSLGQPFMHPFYPLRFGAWKDGIIRLPFSMADHRPPNKQHANKPGFGARKARKNHDIDE